MGDADGRDARCEIFREKSSSRPTPYALRGTRVPLRGQRVTSCQHTVNVERSGLPFRPDQCTVDTVQFLQEWEAQRVPTRRRPVENY
jgi:hypothetical protein